MNFEGLAYLASAIQNIVVVPGLIAGDIWTIIT
jgi:hypothetical protein